MLGDEFISHHKAPTVLPNSRLKQSMKFLLVLILAIVDMPLEPYAGIGCLKRLSHHDADHILDPLHLSADYFESHQSVHFPFGSTNVSGSHAASPHSTPPRLGLGSHCHVYFQHDHV